MRKNILRKNILLVIIVFFVSLLIEIFGFNYRYFFLNENQKGIIEICDSDIKTNNIIFDSGYIATNTQSSITIENSKSIDILRLKIILDKNSSAFEIRTQYPDTKKNERKINLADPLYNDQVFLKIDSKVHPTIELNFNEYLKNNLETSVHISRIEIDNQFYFDWSRFFLLFSILYVLLVLIFNFKYFILKLHITFLIIAIIFGINIVITMPTYFSFDEREHFVKAYQTASFDFGIEKNKEIYWPENIERFFSFNGISTSFDTTEERNNYYDLYKKNDYETKRYYDTTAKPYLPTAYVPAAIGIFLGKFLSLPFINVFYLGRLFNLIAYCLVISILIKQTLIGKRLIFLLGLLPGMLYLACSYSADPVTYSFSLATVTIFINMFYSNKITTKKLVLYLLASSIMITGKITYAPLALLFLILPNKNMPIIKKNISVFKNGFALKFLMLLVLGCVITVNTLYSSFNGLAQWVIEGVSVEGQINFIITHIFTYANICLNYVLKSLPSYFEGPIGNFAYSGTFSSGISYIVTFFMLVLAVVDNNELPKNMGIKNKIYLLFCVLLSWGLVITSLYITFTPVGSLTISGVQGRYFAPLLFPLLLLFKTNKIKNTFKEVHINGFVICLCTFLLLLLLFKLVSGYLV
ncbi:DUF2142 domain-containing protein [Eubacterium maltosivorans]|uniref:DUF2142 domain-containing protein n=1 Tax=Eubacterium maltosivorans TaxID=2041044 RepID=A0A2A5TCN9_EUBML|nr:DUF2142 domain-containing protein [Eubacterium maltosivorans]QCT71587.1 DUF2142 domain-containing protein [Eubacterium maltosivorans]